MVSIIVLATGNHYEYIADLVGSMKRFLLPSIKKDIWVITDRVPAADSETANTVVHTRPPADNVPLTPVFLWELIEPYRSEIAKSVYTYKMDADMLLMDHVLVEDFLPRSGEEFAIVQYFLARTKKDKLETRTIPPTCGAYIPAEQQDTPAWQSCIFGGHSASFFRMGDVITPLMKADMEKKEHYGAWEEAYVCSYLNDKKVRTLPANYASPLKWYKFENVDSLKECYKSLCADEPKIYHFNHTMDHHYFMSEKDVLECRPTLGHYQGLIDFAKWFPEGGIVAEIGSYAGESAKVFLDHGKVKVLFCIDPWEGGYDDRDIASNSNMRRIEGLFDQRLSSYHNFVKVKKKSEDAASMFPDEFFDVVYIDGNHKYEAVKQDILTYLPKVKKGGFLAGHDLNVSEVERAILDTVGRPWAAFADFSWMHIKGQTEIRK